MKIQNEEKENHIIETDPSIEPSYSAGRSWTNFAMQVTRTT